MPDLSRLPLYQMRQKVPITGHWKKTLDIYIIYWASGLVVISPQALSRNLISELQIFNEPLHTSDSRVVHQDNPLLPRVPKSNETNVSCAEDAPPFISFQKI